MEKVKQITKNGIYNQIKNFTKIKEKMNKLYES